MDRLQFAFKTQIGNQNGAAEEKSYFHRNNLFIVIESLGNECLSNVYKDQFFNIIYESFFQHFSIIHSPARSLLFALKEANKEMLQNKIPGEETSASVIVVFIRDRAMYFTYLGDSRIYRLHKGKFNLLTRDHALGLGTDENLTIKVKKSPLHKNDLIFMMTDELPKRISTRKFIRLSSKTKDLEKLCDEFIDIAKREGRNCSVTVGIVKVGTWSKVVRSSSFAFSALFLLVFLVSGFITLKHREFGFLKDQPKYRIPVEQSVVENTEKNTVEENRDFLSATQAMNGNLLQEVPMQEPDKNMEDTVHAFLSRWKAAWGKTAGSSRDFEAYTTLYSDNFSSNGLDKNGWIRDKAEKGRRKRWIRVGVKDIQISKASGENPVAVRFKQDYQSSNFMMISNKKLVLQKEDTGWKIIKELEE